MLANSVFTNGAGEDIWDAPDNLAPEDYEEFEESIVDQATAARTIVELQAEIVILEGAAGRAGPPK